MAAGSRNAPPPLRISILQSGVFICGVRLSSGCTEVVLACFDVSGLILRLLTAHSEGEAKTVLCKSQDVFNMLMLGKQFSILLLCSLVH